LDVSVPTFAPPPDTLADVRAEQVRRWLAGERPSAETLLAEHPDLAADDEAALVLVYGEVLLREEIDGTPPDRTEYEARFPQYAIALARQLELHGALDPLAGPELPGFEIVRELGRGGAGVVYLARDRGLGRLVAVKVLLSGEFASASARRRFRTEAEAAAGLRHTNVVPIHAIGEHGGRPYLVFEYVAGGSLDQQLGGTPLAPRAAAALLRPLADAVQHAHSLGVVHRDLKPGNILLKTEDGGRWTESDRVPADSVFGSPSSVLAQIADFGLAKRLDAGGPTVTSQVLGTPSYMAPEQATGAKEVGPPADVYALGAILYECLTGRPPFKAATPLETLAHVTGREPASPRSLNHAIPRDLETICLKCLTKEPAKRYATAGALADDLDRFLDGRPVLARPVGLAGRGWRWAKRRPAVAALATALAVLLPAALAGMTVLYLHANSERQRAEEQRLLVDERYREGLQYRRQMATEMSNYAYSLSNLQRNAEAIDVHRKCIAEYDRLAEAGINPSFCRLRRAGHLSLLAHSLQQVGGGDETLRVANEAVAACTASVAEWPGDADARRIWQQARSYRAAALRKEGQFETAAGQLDQLIPEALRDHGPSDQMDNKDTFKRIWIRDMYADRALCRYHLRRYSEAIADWDEAMRRDAGTRFGYYAAARAHSLICDGRVRDGLHGLTEPLAARYPAPEMIHEAMWAYADASLAVDLPTVEREAAADRAVELLRRLWADRPDYRKRVLRNEKEFPEAIRGRADFKAILAGK
jgi:tetratricopeptide (TPR) repeat protein